MSYMHKVTWHNEELIREQLIHLL